MVAEAPAVNTSWHLVFFSLRSGMIAEAADAAAARSQTRELLTGRSLKQVITKWSENGGELPEEWKDEVEEDGSAALSDANQRPGSGLRAMIMAVLCKRRRLVNRFLEHCRQAFSTLEDFLWFHLKVVSFDSQSGYRYALEAFLPAESRNLLFLLFVCFLSFFLIAKSWTPGCSLKELQDYLKGWGSAYYSHDGSCPEAYLSTLVLTLQFGSAIEYAASEGSTAGLLKVRWDVCCASKGNGDNSRNEHCPRSTLHRIWPRR